MLPENGRRRTEGIMEQAKQGGNETAPETAGYYRGAGCFSLKAAELNELLGAENVVVR